MEPYRCLLCVDVFFLSIFMALDISSNHTDIVRTQYVEASVLMRMASHKANDTYLKNIQLECI